MTVSKLMMADRFTAHPALVAVVLIGLLFLSGYTAMNFGDLGGLYFLTVIVSFIMFIVYAVRSAGHLMRAHWWKAASTLLPVTLFSSALWWKSEVVFEIDRMRFYLFRAHYVGALTSPADRVEARPKMLHWGFGGLAGIFYRELIFDEADEDTSPDAILPLRARAAFEGRIQSPIIECRTSVRRIERYFYLVEAAC